MNYLQLANKALLKMNEPEIDETLGLSSARGIQKTVLANVQLAYKDMVSDSVQWPFNYNDGLITTVINTFLYARETGTKVIDWDSFDLIITEDSITSSRKLHFADRATERKLFRAEQIQQDVNTATTPYYVYSKKNGSIGLYPTPDKEYTITYEYWTHPPELTLDTDIPLIPEHFHDNLVEGALYHSFYTRSDYEAGDRYKGRFEKAIRQMEDELIGVKSRLTSKRLIPTALQRRIV